MRGAGQTASISPTSTCWLRSPIRSAARSSATSRRPRTVAELAELSTCRSRGCTTTSTDSPSHELVRVVAERRVAAVTERRYQVVAKSFRVDDELLTTTDVRELSIALSSLFDVAKLAFQRFVEAGGVTQERRRRIALGLPSHSDRSAVRRDDGTN